MLILIEGPDGSGKTGIANALQKEIGGVVFHSPRGITALSKKIYDLIKTPGLDEDVKKSLVAASHAENIRQMNHMVENGINVIADRSIPSFFANQSFTSTNWFECYLTESGIPDLNADKVVFLSADRDILMNRLASRQSLDILDRYFLDHIDDIIWKYKVFEDDSDMFYEHPSLSYDTGIISTDEIVKDILARLP